MKKHTPEIIVALDVGSKKEALRYIEMLSCEVRIFKIGLQLFLSEGPEVVACVNQNNREVFLDLKLYDIPNTVCNAAQAIARYGIWGFTVHLQAGADAVKAAQEGAVAGAQKAGVSVPLVVGVTVLTSREARIEEVTALAQTGVAAGMDAVVCSVWEVEAIRHACKEHLKTITPGIRIDLQAVDDQKRVATPQDASDRGVDYIVMGRSILNADDPLQRIRAIKELL
jgi:orotidine-5'-phosphate decarboxylase